MSSDSSIEFYQRCAQKRAKKANKKATKPSSKRRKAKQVVPELKIKSKKVCKGKVTSGNHDGIFLKGVRSHFIARDLLTEENVARRDEDLCRLIDFGGAAAPHDGQRNAGRATLGGLQDLPGFPIKPSCEDRRNGTRSAEDGVNIPNETEWPINDAPRRDDRPPDHHRRVASRYSEVQYVLHGNRIEDAPRKPRRSEIQRKRPRLDKNRVVSIHNRGSANFSLPSREDDQQSEIRHNSGGLFDARVSVCRVEEEHVLRRRSSLEHRSRRGSSSGNKGGEKKRHDMAIGSSDADCDQYRTESRQVELLHRNHLAVDDRLDGHKSRDMARNINSALGEDHQDLGPADIRRHDRSPGPGDSIDKARGCQLSSDPIPSMPPRGHRSHKRERSQSHLKQSLERVEGKRDNDQRVFSDSPRPKAISKEGSRSRKPDPLLQMARLEVRLSRNDVESNPGHRHHLEHGRSRSCNNDFDRGQLREDAQIVDGGAQCSFFPTDDTFKKPQQRPDRRSRDHLRTSARSSRLSLDSGIEKLRSGSAQSEQQHQSHSANSLNSRGEDRLLTNRVSATNADGAAGAWFQPEYSSTPLTNVNAPPVRETAPISTDTPSDDCLTNQLDELIDTYRQFIELHDRSLTEILAGSDTENSARALLCRYYMKRLRLCREESSKTTTRNTGTTEETEQWPAETHSGVSSGSTLFPQVPPGTDMSPTENLTAMELIQRCSDSQLPSSEEYIGVSEGGFRTSQPLDCPEISLQVPEAHSPAVTSQDFLLKFGNQVGSRAAECSVPESEKKPTSSHKIPVFRTTVPLELPEFKYHRQRMF